MILRASAVGIVVATFVTGGAVGAAAIRARFDDASNRAKASEASQRSVSQPGAADSPPAEAVQAGEAKPTTPIAAPLTAAPQSATPPSQPETTASRRGALLAPILPMGESTLPDGVTAQRTDSNVVVSFDLMMVRTRRPEKFEQFVRATLPLIYGSPARDALAKIPSGELASQGDLLTELPARGMHISPGTDWIILLYPETKTDRDGPLVVRYRVSVVPYGQ